MNKEKKVVVIKNIVYKRRRFLLESLETIFLAQLNKKDVRVLPDFLHCQLV